MLFGEYMQVNKKFNVWEIKKFEKFPRLVETKLFNLAKFLNELSLSDTSTKPFGVKSSPSCSTSKTRTTYLTSEKCSAS